MKDENGVEILVYVDGEEYDRRKNICSSCTHFTPSQNVKQEILNASTGMKEIVDVFKFEDCDIDNVVLVGFLGLKTSVCPEGKW